MKDCIVVIPAYEPNERLVELIREIKNKTSDKVIVVNDGSSQKTRKYFENIKPGVTILEHKENKGKGEAIKTALRYLWKNEKEDCDIVIADADGQHKVDDVIKISREVEANKDSLVLGSRKFKGNIPLKSRLGNLCTRFVFECVSGVYISDTQTGLRGFSYKLIPYFLQIEGSRYEYEMNVLLNCVKDNISIKEIPIETIYLEDNKSSHFNPLKDSLKIYKDVIKFSGVSLLSFIIDYALFSIFVLLTTSITLSNILARAISSNFNFFMNKRYVFNSKGNVGKEALKYFSLVLALICANTILLNLIFNNLINNQYISKIIVETFFWLVSYMIQKVLIFKKN